VIHTPSKEGTKSKLPSDVNYLTGQVLQPDGGWVMP